MDFLDKWLNQSCGHANTDEGGRKAAPTLPPRGFMILGTDTDVGKTRVAQILIRHLVQREAKVGAYKPVASGVALSDPKALSTSDPGLLRQATGADWPLERVCPQIFAAALAPPIAAMREGQSVDEPLLTSGAQWWSGRCDVLIVESAGGAMSPLGARTTVLDVAGQLGYPVVLVAAHRLGMMSHVLLTLEAVRRRGLTVAALIVNQVTAKPTSRNAALSPVDHKLEAEEFAKEVRLDESLACLLPFCGKIDCYGLEYEGSTLFPLA